MQIWKRDFVWFTVFNKILQGIFNQKVLYLISVKEVASDSSNLIFYQVFSPVAEMK